MNEPVTQILGEVWKQKAWCQRLKVARCIQKSSPAKVWREVPWNKKISKSILEDTENSEPGPTWMQN